MVRVRKVVMMDLMVVVVCVGVMVLDHTLGIDIGNYRVMLGRFHFQNVAISLSLFFLNTGNRGPLGKSRQ